MKKYYSNDLLYIVRGFEGDKYTALPMIEYNDGICYPDLLEVQNMLDWINNNYRDEYDSDFSLSDITIKDNNGDHWYIILDNILTRVDW